MFMVQRQVVGVIAEGPRNEPRHVLQQDGAEGWEIAEQHGILPRRAIAPNEGGHDGSSERWKQLWTDNRAVQLEDEELVPARRVHPSTCTDNVAIHQQRSQPVKNANSQVLTSRRRNV
jgi:hypothetical protein